MIPFSITPSPELKSAFNISSATSKANVKKLIKIVEDPTVGFFSCLDDHLQVKECYELFHYFNKKRKINHFFHIGIGGSSLGAEMLVTALGKNNTQFTYINNIDPDQITRDLSSLKIENSLFYFVSKSGSTAETMAALAIITEKLSKLGIKNHHLKDYFVFSTDPEKSQLKDFANDFGIKTLRIPTSVGGRFSVLTSVGLFPSLFAGINSEVLFTAAKELRKDLVNEKENVVVKSAQVIFKLMQKGIHQTVLMPYSSKLRNFSFWFVQLWAESLGKKKSQKNKNIFTGLTPIPSYGASDQHSQVQLFMEGPFDKLIIIIEVKKFNYDFSLKNSYPYDSLKKLAPYSLSQLMSAELNGTLKALEHNKRPYLHIAIPILEEKTLASLILYFETLTCLMGEYLNIDPFNQPGVEGGKIFAFEYLQKMTDMNDQ